MPALLMSLILSVCLVGSGGEPAPTTAQEPEAIEIDTVTGHIVLPVWIEGDGPYWFVLDTGNQNTTMFAYVAADAGIETKPLKDVLTQQRNPGTIAPS